MKTKISLMLILSAMIILGSCKKNPAETVQATPAPKQLLDKIKSWYSNQERSNGTTTGKVTGIPVGLPQWERTHYYVYPEKTSFIIPMKFVIDSTNANQFIHVELNNDNEVIFSEYAYIFLKNEAAGNFSKEDLENLEPEFYTLEKVPENLTAWLMKYDFENRVTAASYIEKGKTVDSDIRWNTSPTTRAPKPQCQTTLCIDWYYQVFENGVLIWEQYLYTTCSCIGEDGGTGGGGGPTTPTTGNCNFSQAYAQSVLDNMTSSDPGDASIEIVSTMPPDDAGKLRQALIWKYKFLKINLSLSPYASPQYTAKFPAIRYRYLLPYTDPWKWETFHYDQTVQTDGIIPNCAQVTVAPTVVTFISSDELKAYVEIDYTAIVKIECMGPLGISQVDEPLNGSRSRVVNAN